MINKYVLLAILSLLWGSQFLFIEVALRAAPPLTVAATRILLAAVTLGILFRFSGDRQAINAGPKIPFATFFGIALVDVTLPFCLIAWAQTHLESGTTGILQGTIPLFVVGLSLLVLKSEKPTLGNLLAVGMGFVSLLILNAPSLVQGLGGNLLAQAAVLGGAACYALGILLVRRLNSPHFTWVARNIFFAASLQLVPLALVIDRPWSLNWPFEGLLALALLGVIGTGISKLLFVVLIAKGGPTFASLANYLSPMIALSLGLLFLGERFAPESLIALIILLAALALNGLKRPRNTPTPAGSPT